MTRDDPFYLQRFVDAQAGGVYEQALSEICAGEKRSQWMWFIFPHSAELGRSPTAKFYGLSGEALRQAQDRHRRGPISPIRCSARATANASRRCGRSWMRATAWRRSSANSTR